MFKFKAIVSNAALVAAGALFLASCSSAPSGSAASSASPAASAASSNTILIPKSTSAIAIDGTGTGFPASQGVAIGDSGDGTSGTIKLAYDDTSLYIFAHVIGVGPVNFNQGKTIWNGNALEATLGFDPNESKFAGSMGATDYQIGLSTGNIHAKIPASSYNWTKNINATDSIVAVATADGYNIEAKVPWAQFGFTPASGKSFALDFALDTASAPGLSRDGQWIMDGTADYYHVPSQWTHLGQLQ